MTISQGRIPLFFFPRFFSPYLREVPKRSLFFSASPALPVNTDRGRGFGWFSFFFFFFEAFFSFFFSGRLGGLVAPTHPALPRVCFLFFLFFFLFGENSTHKFEKGRVRPFRVLFSPPLSLGFPSPPSCRGPLMEPPKHDGLFFLFFFLLRYFFFSLPPPSKRRNSRRAAPLPPPLQLFLPPSSITVS